MFPLIWFVGLLIFVGVLWAISNYFSPNVLIDVAVVILAVILWVAFIGTPVTNAIASNWPGAGGAIAGTQPGTNRTTSTNRTTTRTTATSQQAADNTPDMDRDAVLDPAMPEEAAVQPIRPAEVTGSGSTAKNIGLWVWNGQRPPLPGAPGDGEAYLFHGDVASNGQCGMKLFRPGQKPSGLGNGTFRGIKITFSNESELQEQVAVAQAEAAGSTGKCPLLK